MTTLEQPIFEILPETPGHGDEINKILDAAFGLGRMTKTSYRLREGSRPVDGLSFMAKLDGQMTGTIQFWPIVIGGKTNALLLGPLAVLPEYQGTGIGIALIKTGLAAAGNIGHKLALLVGDLPYYSRAGFARVEPGIIDMPGPFDRDRLLYVELEPGAAFEASGLILPPHRLS